MISILFTMMLAHAQERECLEYQEVEITECKNSTIKNGLIGGAVGSAAGYFLGGKSLVLLGGLVGGGTGLATGTKKCETHKEMECIKWKSYPNKVRFSEDQK